MPDDDVLRAAGIAGRELWLWPDVGGEGAMNRLAAHVAPLGCVVKHIHPDVLGLRTHGDDAEQWQPGPDPLGELEAALRVDVAQPTAEAPARLMVPFAEWARDVRQPADEELTAAAPGLLYKGRAVLLHAPRGVAKTTYAAWVAAQVSREGLLVALLVDDDERSWADRLLEFDADQDRIVVGTMANVARAGLAQTLEGADVLIVDSWRRWAATCGARGKGAMNDESQIGSVADEAVDVAHKGGLGVLLIANQGKDPDLGARGSVALEDAVDAVRTITRNGDSVTISTAGKVRHGMPKGPWTLTLGSGGFTHGGGSGGGGELVPGTPEGRYEDAALGWLMHHGESSGTAICRGANGQHRQLRAALDRLLAQGRVSRRDDVRGGWIWAPDPGAGTLDPGSGGSAPDPEPDPPAIPLAGSGGSAPDPEPDPGGGIGISRIVGSEPDPELDPDHPEHVPGPLPPTQEVDREPLTLDELMPFSECEVTGYAAVVAYAKLIPGADPHHELADIGEAYGRLSDDAVARWERITAQTLQRLKRAGVLDPPEVTH